MSVPEQHDAAVTKKAQPAPEGRRTPAQRIRGNRRSLELTGLILILFLVDFFWSSHTAMRAAAGQAALQAQTIAAEQKAIEAGCSFWEPLVSLPVTIVPPSNRPTKLSVRILVGARVGYSGQCQPPHWPPLPPADPSLVKWARFYHITLP
jgi:hypothetical protein